MTSIPVVLCIDVEPDRRVLELRNPPRPAGVERLLALEPKLRDDASSRTGVPARFSWHFRMDPQIAETYGAADWLVTEYQQHWDAVGVAGDAFGVHPHSWRWRDGWVSDQADDAWVAHCAQIGLDTFRATFGLGAPSYRHGDGFMSDAVARQIEADGVRVDLSIEPGRPAVRGLLASETATGWLPDTRTVPRHAYRASRNDFRVADDTRTDGLLFLPLTAGLAVSTRYHDGRLVPTGSYELLELWTAPPRFARMLRLHLRDPDLSHLAFALRADIGLLPTAWHAVEENLAELDRQLSGRYRWCTPVEAAEMIDTMARPCAVERDDGRAGRAASWLHGESDEGYLARAEAEAVDILTEDAGAIVDRLHALGAGGVAVPTPGCEVEAPREELCWVDAEAEVTCPACEQTGPGHRVAIAITSSDGGMRLGVGRCGKCQALVPDWLGGSGDLPDAEIDEYLEFEAGFETVLATLSRVEPTPGTRLLDVGCGYGFGLDLSRFAWGWEGIGVDPWNRAVRGRTDLGLDIRAGGLGSDVDVGSEPFDVVLASDTIEHVPEPVPFLRAIRDHLAVNGVLVMSAPNAAFVDPRNPPHDVLAVIGGGEHSALVDRDGLEQLLRRAGFDAVHVTEEPMLLRAVAARTPEGLARSRETTAIDLGLLARYCDARATQAPAGSALRLGMASRHVQYALHAAAFATAEAGVPRLREALLERHGIDLDDPDGTCERAARSTVPLVAAAAHYAIGFLELSSRGNPRRAARHFAAASMIASAAVSGPSPTPPRLQLRAMGHEALALARCDAARVPPLVHRLRAAEHSLLGGDDEEIEALCAVVLRELVARGEHASADEVRAVLSLPDTAAPDTRPAAPARNGEPAESPRVSVILPLFNGQRYVRGALDSVLAQTIPPCEIVVVDDGSADDGMAEVMQFSAPFPIRVISRPHAGQSAARNAGAGAAEGELLAFLDQDDVWHPEHLARLCRPFAEDSTVGWVYSDFDEIDGDGRTVTLAFLAEHGVRHPRQTLGACLTEDLMVIPSATVVRRSMFESIGGFDPMLQGYEDDDLFVRAFRAGWRLVFDARSLSQFRVHNASSSANGVFAESRRSFSRKLQETVIDDARLNRYYVRDVIAPRFFHSCIDDYVKAVSQRDWEGARRLRTDLKHFARLHRDHSTLRWKIALISRPRVFRWMLRVNESIPLRPSKLKDPRFRLRGTR